MYKILASGFILFVLGMTAFEMIEDRRDDFPFSGFSMYRGLLLPAPMTKLDVTFWSSSGRMYDLGKVTRVGNVDPFMFHDRLVEYSARGDRAKLEELFLKAAEKAPRLSLARARLTLMSWDRIEFSRFKTPDQTKIVFEYEYPR